MKTTTPNSIIAPAALGETASSPTAENPAAPVLLHRGAVNMVWLTVRHGRVVVLKGLVPELRHGHPEFEALLRKEYQLGISLSHPGIVRIEDFLDDPSLGQCIVQEYVDGDTLTAWLGRQHPSRRLRRQVATQIADALAYMHSRGVSHRDLKPDNIMIVSGDDSHPATRVIIIDLGLGDSPDSAVLKRSAATAEYGAPEQLNNESGNARSDVYSFGKIAGDMRLGPLARAACRGCLSDEPERRPAISTVAARLRRVPRVRAAFAMVVVLPLVIAAAISAISPGVTASSPTADRTTAPRIITDAENAPSQTTADAGAVTAEETTPFPTLETPIREFGDHALADGRAATAAPSANSVVPPTAEKPTAAETTQQTAKEAQIREIRRKYMDRWRKIYTPLRRQMDTADAATRRRIDSKLQEKLAELVDLHNFEFDNVPGLTQDEYLKIVRSFSRDCYNEAHRGISYEDENGRISKVTPEAAPHK
ncbi:MAG: protein kinase [Bacteroidales bacterium]|nr:protein kinase [Bacteroidales bacterium]